MCKIKKTKKYIRILEPEVVRYPFIQDALSIAATPIGSTVSLKYSDKERVSKQSLEVDPCKHECHSIHKIGVITDIARGVHHSNRKPCHARCTTTYIDHTGGYEITATPTEDC